jgi:nitrogen fixation/metabolism regulation signal transduction histidine kinase
MIPVAIGMDGSASFRAPMAIAVMGGLITSTALTLVIVPAAFTIIDDIERWFGPKISSVLTSKPPSSSQSKPHLAN